MTAKQEKELMYNFKLAWATERSRPGKKKTAQSCRDDNFSVHVMNVATPPTKYLELSYFFGGQAQSSEERSNYINPNSLSIVPEQ